MRARRFTSQPGRGAGLAMLVLTTLVWGTTFAVVKDAAEGLSAAWVIAARFAVGALALAPFLRGATRRAVLDGCWLGLVLFVAYATQAVGLTGTSANRAAFITALSVIMVPLAGPLLGRRVSALVLAAAGLAVVGVGVMSFEGGRATVGDLWVLGCAASYATYILMLEAAAPRHPPLALAAVQLAVVAALGLVWAAVSGPGPGAAVWGPRLVAVVYLGLVATAATTLVQAVAQRVVPAPQTALVYALEPVFAAVFSFWLLGESLGPRGLAGAALVLVATVLGARAQSGPDWASPGP